MEIDVFPKDITLELFGRSFEVRETYLGALVLLAFILILALIFRFIIFPRFTLEARKMKSTQMLFEYMIDMLDKFTKGAVGSLGERLSPYILAVGAYIIGSGALELIGMRSPLSDLTTTLSFGLSTFVLINYYALREKGIIGRLKFYGKPKPYVAPFKLISDLSTPISLSCRLFGNMLVGYIVMDLLYLVLMNWTKVAYMWVIPDIIAAIVPGVLSLYFVLFHVAVQFYVFSTLSLTFIGEATE
ncbi:MAG: F0F1 ATP synthase subunit A [Firmicutes bacterium]|nr:F0F1 ATP synthase subunit A [Bacillota bacterium]